MTTTRLTLSDEEIDRLIALDRAHFFHAATPLQQHAKEGPRIFVGGEGIYLYDAKGRAFIDGLASLWNVNCGHGRQDIVDAITGQMRQLAFSTSFFGFAHPAGIELAARLARVTPPGPRPLLLRRQRLRGQRDGHQARPVLPQGPGQRAEGQGHLAGPRLPRRDLRDALGDAPPPVPRARQPAHGRVRRGARAVPVSVRGVRDAAGCTEACADAVDALIRREGADTVAMVIARAGPGGGRHHRPAAHVLAAAPRDLPGARRPARRRRGDLRVRADRPLVRRRQLVRGPRHADDRQGADQRLHAALGRRRRRRASTRS